MYPTPCRQSLRVGRLFYFHAIEIQHVHLRHNKCFHHVGLCVCQRYWFSVWGTRMQITKPSVKRGKQRTFLPHETFPGVCEVGAMVRHPDQPLNSMFSIPNLF